jgi:uncharacterized protein (TIGR03083 family)
MRDLVQHTGKVHRWATGIVAHARTEPWNASPSEIVGPWPSDEGLVDWFRSGVDALGSALADAPDDLVCWTFMEAPSARIFWARRQAHEVAIHCADAELAVGRTTAIDPALAADGVDELLVASLTRKGRGPRSDVMRTLAVESTDTSDRWVSTISSGEFVTDRSDSNADCTIRGTASSLDQFLWNRLDRSAVEIEGDPSVLYIWRTGARI